MREPHTTSRNNAPRTSMNRSIAYPLPSKDTRSCPIGQLSSIRPRLVPVILRTAYLNLFRGIVNPFNRRVWNFKAYDRATKSEKYNFATTTIPMYYNQYGLRWITSTKLVRYYSIFNRIEEWNFIESFDCHVEFRLYYLRC